MSLILDALRKSEAERRRNETPDLLTAVSAAPSAQPRRRPAVPTRMLAIAASAVLIIALGVWLDRRVRQDAMPVDDGRSADITAGSVDTASAPPSPIDTGNTVDTTSRSPEVAVGPTVTPPPLAPATPSNTLTTPPTPSAVAAAAIDPPATLPSPRMQTGAIPPPAPAAPVVPTPVPSPAHAGVNADAGTPLAPSQLGAETRRQMPPLKMSMHLWNEAASQRFVVLDGQRLGEGDVVGDVVVERIDRDAVIVVWRGERVRLPVR